MLISQHIVSTSSAYVADAIVSICATLSVQHGMNLTTEKSINGTEVTIKNYGNDNMGHESIAIIDEALDKNFLDGEITSYTKKVHGKKTNKNDVHSHTSLVLVDMQNGFINHHTRHIVPRVVEHINSGYNSIIATQFFASEKFTRVTGFDMKKFSYGNNSSLCRQVSGEYDTLIFKDTYGTQGRCAEALRDAGSTSAVIIGVDTEVCVCTIATELVDEGFDVYVDKAACASTGGLASHRYGISALSRIIHPSRLSYPVHV